jgi:hypothetical protein
MADFPTLRGRPHGLPPRVMDRNQVRDGEPDAACQSRS